MVQKGHHPCPTPHHPGGSLGCRPAQPIARPTRPRQWRDVPKDPHSPPSRGCAPLRRRVVPSRPGQARPRRMATRPAPETPRAAPGASSRRRRAERFGGRRPRECRARVGAAGAGAAVAVGAVRTRSQAPRSELTSRPVAPRSALPVLSSTRVRPPTRVRSPRLPALRSRALDVAQPLLHWVPLAVTLATPPRHPGIRRRTTLLAPAPGQAAFLRAVLASKRAAGPPSPGRPARPPLRPLRRRLWLRSPPRLAVRRSGIPARLHPGRLQRRTASPGGAAGGAGPATAPGTPWPLPHQWWVGSIAGRSLLRRRGGRRTSPRRGLPAGTSCASRCASVRRRSRFSRAAS